MRTLTALTHHKMRGGHSPVLHAFYGSPACHLICHYNITIWIPAFLARVPVLCYVHQANRDV
jgi:hypothetical protein